LEPADEKFGKTIVRVFGKTVVPSLPTFRANFIIL